MRATAFPPVSAAIVAAPVTADTAPAQMPGSEPIATCLAEFLKEGAILAQRLTSMLSVWCGPDHAGGHGVRIVTGSDVELDKPATIALSITRYPEPADWVTGEGMEQRLEAVVAGDESTQNYRILDLARLITLNDHTVEVRAVVYDDTSGRSGYCVEAISAESRNVVVDLCRDTQARSDDVVAADILAQLSGVRW